MSVRTGELVPDGGGRVFEARPGAGRPASAARHTARGDESDRSVGGVA